MSKEKEKVLASQIEREFRQYLASKGWSSFGRDSLSKKLKIKPHIITAALKSRPLNERSKYLLWRATEKSLPSLAPENLSELMEWLYEHNETVPSLAAKIKKKTGRQIKVGTLSSILYQDNAPTRENAEALYKVTGVKRYLSGEDPVAATKRLLQSEAVKVTKSISEPEVSRKPYLEGLFLELGEKLPAEVVFAALAEVLAPLRKKSLSERQKFVESIGAEKLGYWVGFLASLTDENQFQLWSQMSNHSLANGR